MIDHAAKPALGAPADDPRHALWRDGMARLAKNPSTTVKLSGLLTEMRPDQRASASTILETLRPLVGRLLEWFGPDRVVWGSDWPVLTLAAPYDAWWQTTQSLLEELSATDRGKILGGNAAAIYRLGKEAA